VIFSHALLPKYEIHRIDSPNGRKYLTPDGNSYESVTSYLGRIEDNSWLDEWRKNVGEKEANKITKRASDRGTNLHNNAEQYLLNNEVNVSTMSMLDRGLFIPFSKVLDLHVNNVRALEYPLYSDTLKLAGTVDCVAEYDGVISLIDFKTAKARKNKEDITNYFLQTTIYSFMIQELYGIKIENLVIIMGLDWEDKVQIFKESRKNWIPLLTETLKSIKPK
jgi:genome maintenance exonuclease 1